MYSNCIIPRCLPVNSYLLLLFTVHRGSTYIIDHYYTVQYNLRHMVWGSIARYYYKIMWYGMVQFSYLVFQNVVKIIWFSHILKVYLLFGIRIIFRYPGNILASSQKPF